MERLLANRGQGRLQALDRCRRSRSIISEIAMTAALTGIVAHPGETKWT